MVTLQNLTELYPSMLDDNIVLPDGLSKDTLKSVIMMRLGLCWPVYDEPEVFGSMLYSWCMSHQWNIERLLKVSGVEYAPLENYDRIETFSDSKTGSSTTADVNTNTINLREIVDNDTSGRTVIDNDTTGETVIDNDTSGSGTSNTNTTSETVNSVSAYNSTTFQNDSKSEGTGSNDTTTSSTGSLDETRTETGTLDETRTETGTLDQTKTNTGTNIDERHVNITNNDIGDHNGRVHGNIGTMTTQSMFSQELALLSGYNMYYTICNWIERDLFIQVY